jgi:hypothetical protein
MGTLQKFAIFVEYEKNLEDAKKIISESEMIGHLLNSKENCYISDKELHVFDREHYSFSLYDELLEIKQKLAKAGYKTRVLYVNADEGNKIKWC